MKKHDGAGKKAVSCFYWLIRQGSCCDESVADSALLWKAAQSNSGTSIIFQYSPIVDLHSSAEIPAGATNTRAQRQQIFETAGEGGEKTAAAQASAVKFDGFIWNQTRDVTGSLTVQV